MKIDSKRLKQIIREELNNMHEGDVADAIKKGEAEKAEKAATEIEPIIANLLKGIATALKDVSDGNVAKMQQFKGYLMTAMEQWEIK